MSIRVATAGAVLVAIAAACSPVLPPSAAILENGVPLIEYKRCEDIEAVRDIRVYPIDDEIERQPIWTARLEGIEAGSTRIAFADDVPGYAVSAAPAAYRPDRLLHADAHDIEGRWLGGPDFRLAELLEGKALTSFEFDGSTSYTPAERWRADRSYCPDPVWPVMLAMLLFGFVVIVVMAVVDRRRRRLIVALPIPPPAIRPKT